MCWRFILTILCLCCFELTPAESLAQTKTEGVNEKESPKPRAQKNKARKKNKKVEERKYASFREAQTAGYELKNAGKLEASRKAYEAALAFDSTTREKCEVYRELISIYPELGEWESMYMATEYIVENAPYPAFSSLSVRSMNSQVYRKKKQDELFSRYEAKLESNPKDRTTLIILESAVGQLIHDMPRQADYLRRLIELDVEEGKAPDPDMQTELAFALNLSDKEVESAELYESIAKSHADFRSYCLAQAAESWQRAGESEKSLAAATEASTLGPDVRANRSLYNWHRLLGDLFIKHLVKDLAKKHYTAALEYANIDAYRDQCREQLRLVEALKDE